MPLANASLPTLGAWTGSIDTNDFASLRPEELLSFVGRGVRQEGANEPPAAPKGRSQGKRRGAFDQTGDLERAEASPHDGATEMNAKAKFNIGRLVATPNALQTIASEDVMAALGRHVTGDWGDVGREDRQENELSLKE